MTPEEINRAMEFIIQSQARLAAAQEQDRRDRIESQEWSKGLTTRVANLTEQVVVLAQSQAQALLIQSRRLDEQEKFYQSSLDKMDKFQNRALHLLHMILDRLPPLRPSES